MDNKNVFIAIALSMSVLLFWGAFFESPNSIDKTSVPQQEIQGKIKNPTRKNQPVIQNFLNKKKPPKKPLNNDFVFTCIQKKSPPKSDLIKLQTFVETSACPHGHYNSFSFYNIISFMLNTEPGRHSKIDYSKNLCQGEALAHFFAVHVRPALGFCVLVFSLFSVAFTFKFLIFQV